MPEWMESDRTRILAVLVLLSLVAVVYIGLTATATSDSHTEFYVLGPDGQASEYPTNLSVNESGTVLVGLSNHEGTSTTYTVELRLGDERVDSRTVTLREGETWEQNVSFTPRSPGSKQLHVLLYEGESVESASDPTQRLHLWIDVQNESTQPGVRVNAEGSDG